MSATWPSGPGLPVPVAVGLLRGERHVLEEADAGLLGLLVAAPAAVGAPLAEVATGESGELLCAAVDEALRRGADAQVVGWPGPLGPVDFVVSPRLSVDGGTAGVLVLGFEPGGVDDMTGQVDDDLLDRAFVGRLKAAVLPDRLPALPTVDLGAAHLAADRPGTVGGDWFDAVVRSDGSVVLVIGDAAGWGVPGVVASCELRAVLHERLCSGVDLVAALEAADTHLRCAGTAGSATACLVELDVETGALRYVTAGHPPPLLWSATAGARFLRTTSGSPLGTIREWPVHHDRLELDEVVLLSSDGLLERPRREASAGTVEVVAAVDEIMRGPAADDRLQRSSTAAVDVLSRTLISSLSARTGHSDDVTVLAAQRRSRVRDLVLALPVGPEASRAARHQVAEWLQTAHPGGFDLAAAEHVLDELVRNVVQHAYPDGVEGEVRVTVHWDSRGGLTMTVADDGRWHEADGPAGHGLALVSELARSVEVRDEPFGTTVVVAIDLNRVTQVVEPASPPGPGGTPPLRVRWSDDRTVRVSGSVDVDAAERLRILLMRGTTAGTRRTTLDLTGVTHLGAAAVKVLFDLTHTERGSAVSLVAPAGSTAQQVLERVGLDYRP